MKKYLAGIVIGVGLAFAGVAYAVNVTIPQSTGYGVIPVGNASGGNYSLLATSSLGLSTFSYPFASNATSTKIDFSGGLQVGTLGGFIGGNSGTLYNFATSTIKTSQLTNDAAFLASITADTPLSGSGTSASHLVLDTSGTWSGNAGTATKLLNARTINGVSFDGTANIVVASTTLLGSDTNTFTNLLTMSSGATTTSLHANGLADCNGATNALTYTYSSGSFGCNTITGSSFSYPFTPSTFGTLAVSATTTAIYARAGLITGTSTIGSLTATSTVTFTGISTGLVLSTTGTLSAYAGTSCTNQFVRSLSASGSATCATISSSDVSLANLTATNATLTFSGTYNGSTARTIGLNVGNANNWTALQTFTNASSTQFSAASQTFYIDSNGKITAKDTVNGWSGTLSPTHRLALPEATSTGWIGTTTGAYTGRYQFDFAGTFKALSCNTEKGFTADWHVYGALNQWVVSASSTLGVYALNTTFNAGDTIYWEAGHPSSAAATTTICNLDITQS